MSSPSLGSGHADHPSQDLLPEPYSSLDHAQSPRDPQVGLLPQSLLSSSFHADSLSLSESSWSASYRRASLFNNLRERPLHLTQRPSVPASHHAAPTYGSLDDYSPLEWQHIQEDEEQALLPVDSAALASARSNLSRDLLHQPVKKDGYSRDTPHEQAGEETRLLSPIQESLASHEGEDLETEVWYDQNIILAKSTFNQSLFNAVNILMGIGLLSLPFAFRITGWAVGIGCLCLFSAMTHHTGRILQLVLDYERPDGFVSLTYGDLGEVAYGRSGRTFISIVFFLELLACIIALVILSADSIVALFPWLDINLVKICTVVLVFPMTLPASLAIAAYASLLGILALFNLMGILVYDGLTNHLAPGSLWQVADTQVLPADWFPVPLAFGLLMAGFSGHSVFPNLYRDMKDPARYPQLLNTSYVVVLGIYLVIASVGYAMFGAAAREEITQNLPLVASFDPILTKLTVGLVALNPLTKYPLSANPVNFHIGIAAALTIEQIIVEMRLLQSRWYARFLACLLSSLFVLLISIYFPGFHHVMALLGSFFSFTVSVVFPELCYLHLFGRTMKRHEWLLEVVVLVLGISFGLVGTIWVFL
ncbi:hypothetical protein HDV03_002354 [Kappamyces sp. JEL0829]|nr:hypothetical protein HDV03_002354 [Kappamyces sp. JEL0829]